MPRYKLTIAYDGTDFHGWQRQLQKGPGEPTPPGAEPPPEAAPERDPDPAEATDESLAPEPAPGVTELRTVQQLVQRAVRLVVREPVQVQGASRTDAGVHARAQVGAFTCTDARRGPEDARLALAINSRLPSDVVVRSCERVRDDFEPIADCVSKGYRYNLHVSKDRPLWRRRYVHHVRTPLDVDAMRAAAAMLVGEHDFAAFTNAGHGRLTTVRTVLSCAVDRPEPESVVVDVSSTGFLYNMVRIITGTLVEVGRGRLTLDRVARALETGDRRLAGPTMPPTGLFLEWIRYKDEDASCTPEPAPP